MNLLVYIVFDRVYWRSVSTTNEKMCKSNTNKTRSAKRHHFSSNIKKNVQS